MSKVQHYIGLLGRRFINLTDNSTHILCVCLGSVGFNDHMLCVKVHGNWMKETDRLDVYY